jgi:hypothetical protein
MIIYADVADGHIESDEELNFNTAWTAATGTVVNSLPLYCSNDFTGLGTYVLARGFLIFDTSLIPVGLTITSAILYLAQQLPSGTGIITVQNGQPTYPHLPLEPGDYAKGNYGGDGGTIDLGSKGADTYYPFPLNALGMSWINKGGWTKLCLRLQSDINNITPIAFEEIGICPAEDPIYPAILAINESCLGTIYADYITTNSALLHGWNWIPAGDYYCGFQYWEAANPGVNATIWYNPPYPEHLRDPITGIRYFSLTAENLKPDTYYYFRVVLYDLVNYTFSTEVPLFKTLVEVPIFGPVGGLGYDYLTSKRASEYIAKLAIGRMYNDAEGYINYESKGVRP